MKRLLLSVFAAALTAAWAVPSVAADVTFGGQYRLRGEYWNNTDYNKNANDHNSFWGQRVRLTANAKATDDTSVKITLQDTRAWGLGAGTAGGPALTDNGNTFSSGGVATATANNTTDLHESYVNVENLFGAPLALRAGRQELVYGDERLIGAFGWSNNGRSFDALKLAYTSDPVNVDVFYSKIVEASTTARDQDFEGIYATVKSIPNNTLDVYVLRLADQHQDTAAPSSPFGFGSTIGNTAITGKLSKTQTLYTYGARLKGAVQALDYTLELPLQTGKIDTSTSGASTGRSYKISTWAAAAKVGYTLPTAVKVRVGAEYDIASGDKDGTNDKIKTFFNLFPTNHDKLGLMDQQAWRNVKAFNLNVTAEATEKLKLMASLWNFSLDKKEDAWYSAAQWNNTPTTGIRAASTTNAKASVGNELDLVATYKYNNALSAELGLARFFEGKFIKDKVAATAGTGKADADWAYLMLTANF